MAKEAAPMRGRPTAKAGGPKKVEMVMPNEPTELVGTDGIRRIPIELMSGSNRDFHLDQMRKQFKESAGYTWETLKDGRYVVSIPQEKWVENRKKEHVAALQNAKAAEQFDMSGMGFDESEIVGMTSTLTKTRL